jgi:3-methylfumaryl-CoA hydratase
VSSWEPHTVVTEEYVDPAPVQALTAVFDSGAAVVKSGDPLPPLWHWAALARWPVSSSIGSDGHPARGEFLPPIELPRRMFAGGEVRWSGAITVGSTVRRRARVVSVTPKSGRTGELVVVVVEIELFTGGDREPAVVERQNLIYREAAAPGPAGAPAPVAVEPVGAPLRRRQAWDWELRTDPTVLMRFSAATANAHRIHYDWPYATTVEGYPGLVVHGPLMTLALAETIRLESPARIPVVLRHRNLAPLFCPRPACIRREPGDDAELSVAVVSTDDSGESVTHTVLTAEYPSPGEI